VLLDRPSALDDDEELFQRGIDALTDLFAGAEPIEIDGA
jgi:hypothetical protein